MLPHYGSIISVNHMITLTNSEKPLNCFLVAKTLPDHHKNYTILRLESFIEWDDMTYKSYLCCHTFF